MKKLSLIVSVILFSTALMAQQKQNPFVNLNELTAPPRYTPEPPYSGEMYAPIGKHTRNTQNLGTGPNAFGMAFGAKTPLWADPVLNTVLFTHRSDPAVHPGGYNGDLRFDISRDGGVTWSLDTAAYLSDGGGHYPGNPIMRYPNGGIYNPIGNTDPDSAWGTYFGPTRDSSNFYSAPPNTYDWGGVGHGVRQLHFQNAQTQHSDSSDKTNGFFEYIPSDWKIAKNGMAYGIDDCINFPSGVLDYTDNLIFHYGTFNNTTKDFDYQRKLINAPVEIDNHGNKIFQDVKIAFGDDGLTGYIVILGHNSFAARADSLYFPIIYKTTDGGQTWGPPINLDLYPLDAEITNLGAGSGSLITSAFECDLAVDMNNNLHIAIAFGEAGVGQGFSIVAAPGFWTTGHIYTTDGGTSWFGESLHDPETLQGIYGDNSTTNLNLTEENRPQISRNWAGDKLFFTWFDTDTTQFATVGNTFPNIWAVGYDINTENYTTPTDVSSGLGEAMFGVSSYYVLGMLSPYTLPVAYSLLSGSTPQGHPLGTGVAVQYKYNDDGVFNDADFINAGTPTPLNTFTVGIDDASPIKADYIQVSPNPAKGNVQLTYLLNNKANVDVEVVNILGEKVYSLDKGTQLSGVYTVNLPMEGKSKGIYFVKINFGSESHTTKLVLQ